jgi:hypothetical protein
MSRHSYPKSFGFNNRREHDRIEYRPETNKTEASSHMTEEEQQHYNRQLDESLAYNKRMREESDNRREKEESQYDNNIKINIETKPIIFKEESISMKRVNEIINRFCMIIPSAGAGGKAITMTQDEFRGTPEYYSVESCENEKDRIHQLLLKDPNNNLLKSWKF